MQAQTISPEYLALCQKMHEVTPSWGSKGGAEMERVRALSENYACKSILDYGCGKGRLAYRAAKIGLKIDSYDPAFKPFEASPEPADMVVCRDVMEHIEPEYVDAVLKHIRELAMKVAYFSISLRLANQLLPDGRNAHLIVASEAFWLVRLAKYFTIIASNIWKTDLRIVCIPHGSN